MCSHPCLSEPSPVTSSDTCLRSLSILMLGLPSQWETHGIQEVIFLSGCCLFMTAHYSRGHCQGRMPLPGNSYKRKHLIGTCLDFQRISPLSTWQKAWQHTGRYYAESSTSAGSKNRNIGSGLIFWSPKSTSYLKTYFLKKVIPTSARPHLLSQVAPLPDDQAFKSMSLMVATLWQTTTDTKLKSFSTPTPTPKTHRGWSPGSLHRASTPLLSLCPNVSQSTSLSAPLSSRPPLVWPCVNGSASILIQSTTVHTQPVSSGQANYFSLLFGAF